MSVRRRIRAACALALSLGFASVGWADGAPYVLIPLPQSTIQAGVLNDAGRFLFKGDSGQPAVWERGVVVPIAPANSTFLPTGLSNSDQVVGANVDNSGGLDHLKFHPESWTFTGGLIAQPGVTSGFPFAINSSGVFVGGAGFDNPITTFEAFTHDGGGYHHLGFASGDNASVAFDLNDSGVVAGVSGVSDVVGAGLGDSFKTAQAAIWKNGKPTVIGGLPGDTASAALRINAGGDVLGVSGNPVGGLGLGFLSTGPAHGFLYHNGSFTSLGSLGGQLTNPNSINSAGQIVGTATNAAGVDRAFIYQGGKIHDLNGMIDSATNPTNLTLISAASINKDGVVLVGTESADGNIDNYAVLFPTALYGATERYPVLADLKDFGQPNNDVFQNALNGKWFVEPTAKAIIYQTNDTDLITSVKLPTLGFTKPITIETLDGKLGAFAPGSIVDFTKLLGHGVIGFAAEDILGQPGVIDAKAFAVQLSFNVPQTSFFAATRFPNGIPLPTAAMMFPTGAAMAVFATATVRRRAKRPNHR